MTTAAEIVEEARTWLSTRWSHQHRSKGIATDCAGIVIGVAAAKVGFSAEIPPYGRQPSNDSMMKLCQQHMIRTDKPALGRVAVMKFDKEPQHMGIFGDYPLGGLSLIHAHARNRMVVEHRFDDVWASRLVGVFILPGVIE